MFSLIDRGILPKIAGEVCKLPYKKGGLKTNETARKR